MAYGSYRFSLSPTPEPEVRWEDALLQPPAAPQTNSTANDTSGLAGDIAGWLTVGRVVCGDEVRGCFTDTNRSGMFPVAHAVWKLELWEAKGWGWCCSILCLLSKKQQLIGPSQYFLPEWPHIWSSYLKKTAVVAVVVASHQSYLKRR